MTASRNSAGARLVRGAYDTVAHPAVAAMGDTVDTFLGASRYRRRLAHVAHPSVAVLLTATVDPGTTPFVLAQDPRHRLAEYVSCFRSWLDAGARADCAVVLCENSGTGLDALQRISDSSSCTSRVIAVSSNRDAHERGKGAGEMALIAAALEQAPELAAAEYVLKVTGRFYVRNWEMLLWRCFQTGDADVFADIGNDLRVAETRCFLARRSFLREFCVHHADQIDDHRGRYIEHVLASAIHRGMGAGRMWLPLTIVPAVVGRSATTGESMTRTPLRYLVAAARRRMFLSLLRAAAQ